MPDFHTSAFAKNCGRASSGSEGANAPEGDELGIATCPAMTRLMSRCGIPNRTKARRGMAGQVTAFSTLPGQSQIGHHGFCFRIGHRPIASFTSPLGRAVLHRHISHFTHSSASRAGRCAEHNCLGRLPPAPWRHALQPPASSGKIPAKCEKPRRPFFEGDNKSFSVQPPGDEYENVFRLLSRARFGPGANEYHAGGAKPTRASKHATKRGFAEVNRAFCPGGRLDVDASECGKILDELWTSARRRFVNGLG